MPLSANHPVLSAAQIKSVNYDLCGLWGEYVFASERNLAVLTYSYCDLTGVKRVRGINEHGEDIDLLFNDVKLLDDAEIAN